MKDSRIYYKTCRELAGLTQEDAAPLLGVSVRRLSDYENGEKVPEDMVDRMVQAYNTPLLAWWHLKNNSMLGKYLPDITLPQSPGDMGFHIILAHDDIETVVDSIKALLSDGTFTQDEHPKLGECVRHLKIISGRAMSAATYAEQNILLKEGGKRAC